MPIDRKCCVELRDPMHALGRRKSLREASESRSGTEKASVYALRQVRFTEADGSGIKSAISESRQMQSEPRRGEEAARVPTSVGRKAEITLGSVNWGNNKKRHSES